ncbi:hypothetical protein ACM66B_001834 [Microbotryomycetes sp. NB124-2]
MPAKLSDRVEQHVAWSNSSVLVPTLGRVFANLYTPTNENGVINAGLAENSLLHDWLIQFYDSHFKMTSLDLTYGTSLLGSTRLFEAYSKFLNSHFSPHDPVSSTNQIIAGAGLSAILDCLSRVLFDAGDLMLIARPYYNALVADFRASGDVELVGVVIPEGRNGTLEEVKAMNQEMERLKSEGKSDRVKAVFLMNPHNPLGFNYSREVLLAYCRLAEKWNLWLVADEIYALSVFDSDVAKSEPFISVLSLDVLGEVKCDPGRIIHLYGASKDFGSNGIRIGLMTVQRNERLYQATASLAWPMKISSPADIIFSALLESPELSDYIKRNQAALSESYAYTTSWLKQRNIPYSPAQAGHYVLIDLREYLVGAKGVGEADLLAGEIGLLNKMVEAGVYLGPGHSYFCPEAGFFRLSHSIPRNYLALALERLGAVLDSTSRFGGSTRLLEAYSKFLHSHFSPHDPVSSTNQIIAGAGLSAILDCLSRILFDAGDLMLIATPFYNTLVDDFRATGDVELVGVVVPEGQNGTLEEVKAMDKEMERLKAEGTAEKVKAVFLLNPHNPLGFNYPREVLLAYCRLAEKWNLWLVADEIYALSVFDSDAAKPEPFISVLSLDVLGEAHCDPGRIVHLYGASKDFGSNGIRLGLMTVQHNEDLYRATASLARTMKISSSADVMFSALLKSPELPDYIQRNQAALSDSYACATLWLKQRHIPYSPAQAGHYVLIDLREYLDRVIGVDEASLLKGEIDLLNKMVEAGVYLGPGHSYFCPEAGFFRLTHSLPRDYLELALQRLGAVLDSVKK